MPKVVNDLRRERTTGVGVVYCHNVKFFSGFFEFLRSQILSTYNKEISMRVAFGKFLELVTYGINMAEVVAVF